MVFLREIVGEYAVESDSVDFVLFFFIPVVIVVKRQAYNIREVNFGDIYLETVFGTGGRESVMEGFGPADRHRADMYDWVGDETSNEALC